MSDAPVARIAPNNPVFDLPVIVAIEEGLFEKAGLNVRFIATYDDRKQDQADQKYLERLKEDLMERGQADNYNVCEWATIERVETGCGGAQMGDLRAAVGAQAILTFDDNL